MPLFATFLHLLSAEHFSGPISLIGSHTLAAEFQNASATSGTPSTTSSRLLLLQPVVSNDIRNRRLQRRISRTDLDFEQALQAEGTVLLREGVDISSLGQDSSPPLIAKSYSSSFSPVPSPVGPRARMNTRNTTPIKPCQPGTPIVVPPTPTLDTTTPGRSSFSTPETTFSTPSPHAQTRNDILYDPTEDDTERQTNRRSIYRSPGTSSSPDLTTLLRKAKERGGVINTQQYKNFKERQRKRQDTTPPLPSFDRPSTAGAPTVTRRQRSSASASPSQSIPTTPPKSHNEKKGDWMHASPCPKETGTLKVSVMLLFLKEIEANC